jgi:phosphatidylglycerophosphatase A
VKTCPKHAPGMKKETPDKQSDPMPAASNIRVYKPPSHPSSWAWPIATFFGIGSLPLGPGTWASFSTVLLWWLITHLIPVMWQTASSIMLATLAIAAGIPAATQVARELHRKDPACVVIDEVAGQLISLVAVPVNWKTLLVGFILFRAFDTTKPPPVRQLERLPEGTGIVVDDIGAGLYALVIMQILLHYRVIG